MRRHVLLRNLMCVGTFAAMTLGFIPCGAPPHGEHTEASMALATTSTAKRAGKRTDKHVEPPPAGLQPQAASVEEAARPEPEPAILGAPLKDLKVETAKGVSPLNADKVGGLKVVQAPTSMIVADARVLCAKSWSHFLQEGKKIGYKYESCEVTHLDGKEVLSFHFHFVVPEANLKVESHTVYSAKAPGEILLIESSTSKDDGVVKTSLRREDKAWRYIKRGGPGGNQSRLIDRIDVTLENSDHAFDALLRRGRIKPGDQFSYRWFDPDTATSQRDGTQLLATVTQEVGGKPVPLHKVERVLQLGALRAELILDKEARELVGRIKDRLMYRDTESAATHIPKAKKNLLAWIFDNMAAYLGVGIAAVALFFVFVVPFFKKARKTVAKKASAPGKVDVVRALLGKKFKVADASDSLWHVDIDPDRTKNIDKDDATKLTEIFDDEGLFGYQGRYFVKLARDRWDHEDETLILEVMLFWQDHQTPFEVEIELGTDDEEGRERGDKKVFSTGHQGFDAFFPKRVANPPVIERLSAAGRKLNYVKDFSERWGKHLYEVKVSDSLEIKFDASLLTEDKDPAARVEALLSSACALAETIEQAIDPSFVSAGPPAMDGPRYALVEVLHTCPKCRAGLPLNGPLSEVQCQQCQSSITFQPGFWDLLVTPHKDFLKGAGGFQRNFQTSFSWRAKRPKCAKCDGDLPVDDIPVGTTGSVFCPNCGSATSTFPAPVWLRDVAPAAQQIYGAEGTPGPGGAAPLEINQAAPAPVVLSCPQCGGGLTVTAESSRTTQCMYCHVDVFLPDELWKRLHPVKTSSHWCVRYTPME